MRAVGRLCGAHSSFVGLLPRVVFVGGSGLSVQAYSGLEGRHCWGHVFTRFIGNIVSSGVLSKSLCKQAFV